MLDIYLELNAKIKILILLKFIYFLLINKQQQNNLF